MSKPIIEVKNLSKVYNIGHEQKSAPGTLTFRDSLTQTLRKPLEIFTGHRIEQEKFWALKDVNFEVSQGDVVGIIGRNGSGKSTLLKVLSRIVEPTEGEITMRGRVASLLEVGTGFHPELTGRENVYFNGAILGMSQKEIKSKFDEIVAFSEVEKFLDTPVKFYSSGMYVRLAFAVAAHLDPDILIVDEVLAVGDAAFQKKCLGKMKDVAGQGRTVLFVSHSPAAVEQLCSRGIFLESGMIRKTGLISEVLASYLEQGADQNESKLWRKAETKEYSNGYFEPLELRIEGMQAGGERTKGQMSCREDLCISLSGLLQKNDDELTLGIAVYGENGETLFWSYPTDEGGSNMLKLGSNNIACTLPGGMLNEGSYRIELIGGIHNKRWIFAPGSDTPTIQFSLKGGLSDSPFWVEKRPGILAPKLKWGREK